MSALPKAVYTPEEYLALDREAEFKSEYHAGEIFAMAGASENHDTITVNVTVSLGSQVRGGPCRLSRPPCESTSAKRIGTPIPT